MFNDSVTRRLVNVETELNSQKIATPLNYGQLAGGSRPTASISSGFQINNVPVRWAVRFTRTDGVELAPMADLCWNMSTSPYNQWVTGVDRQAQVESAFDFKISDIGAGWIEWVISVEGGRAWPWDFQNTVNVTINVEAVSMVPGNISIRRV